MNAGPTARIMDTMVSLKQLVIIDAIGAILSSLGAVIVSLYLDGFVVLPHGWLGFAIIYPLAIMAFDALAIVRFQGALRHCLKITISLNALFILSAIGVMAFRFDAFNVWGLVYLVSDIVIVSALSAWQLRSIGLIGRPSSSPRS